MLGSILPPHILDEIQINTPELQIRHLQEHLEHLQVQPTSLAPPRIYIDRQELPDFRPEEVGQ